MSRRFNRLFGSFALCLLVIAPLLLFSAPSGAEEDVDGLETLLPHHETEAEREFWRGREDQMPRIATRDLPPAGPIRNCAEWEPCTGVLVRYPFGIPYNLLNDFDDDVTIHVVVSSSYQTSAYNNLEGNGVDMARVQFLVRPNNSIWTRDYGPWFVFTGADDLAIINHTYNRPYRPDDNNIPLYFGQQQGIDVYSHDMYHTGGNYMTDGAHISSSTVLVYNEAASHNGMNSTQVDELMYDFYGVENYMVMEYIESGGIHHIDTWAKFLDEETVLVKQVWASHSTYTPLEQRATLLASLPSSTGRNYRVHRVYCYNIGGSSPASYTNSLILNDRIYVPFFGNSSYDNQALAAYEAAAPGYEVNGYYYSGFISDDALHCRTKGVMDSGMLRVSHIPIIEEQADAVAVSAGVKAYSGAELTSVEINYRHGDSAWQTLAMSPSGGDQYTATIPVPGSDTTCDYYIHAEDASGRAEGMPRVEPARFYSFDHLGDPLSVDQVPDADALLNANYPNPFNPRTTFSFELKYPDHAELVIVDARGHLVRTLVDGQCKAGTNTIDWDGTDDNGRRLASGVYYYRLRAAGLQYTRIATMVK